MNSELAPAVAIKVTQLNLDNSDSSIKITGSINDWFFNKIVNLFKSKIFNMITEKLKS